MLKKRQLEDVDKCASLKCTNCNMVGDIEICVEKLAQTALAYQAMLERLEWAGDVDGISGFCQMCGEYKSTGHATNCELAALLKESEVDGNGEINKYAK